MYPGLPVYVKNCVRRRHSYAKLLATGLCTSMEETRPSQGKVVRQCRHSVSPLAVCCAAMKMLTASRMSKAGCGLSSKKASTAGSGMPPLPSLLLTAVHRQAISRPLSRGCNDLRTPPVAERQTCARDALAGPARLQNYGWWPSAVFGCHSLLRDIRPRCAAMPGLGLHRELRRCLDPVRQAQ